MIIKRITRYIAAALIATLLPLQFAFAAPDFNPQDKSKGYRTDQIIVKYENSDSFDVVKLTSGRGVADAVRAYGNRADVAYAEPDYIAHAAYVPNDSLYSYQWNLTNNPVDSDINAEQAWDVTMGSNSVIVAVIDTGVAYENNGRYKQASDLSSTCFVQGYDFINNDAHPNDDEGHGTHVTGTIAQSTGNGEGVAGIAPNTCIMPVKALDETGSGSYSAIAAAIDFAVASGANIINMSLGGTASSITLENAVANAYNNGVTVIAAAGNDNTSAPHYPSSYNDYVISVGATDYNADRAYYSNYGGDVDIAAPGGDVTVDADGDGYVDGILQQTIGSNPRDFGYYFYQGTSMASPHVAGIAALLVANNTASTPDDIRSALESTARDIGDTSIGAGLVDAYAALQWNSGPVDNAPTVTLTSPADGATVAGNIAILATATDDVAVEKVEFYVDATLIATDTVAPYEAQWDTTSPSDGTYTVKAIAYDAVQTSEDSIQVIVDNIPDPNQDPTANAGGDQTVIDSDSDGSELVTLSGSAIDADGSIVSYVWTVDGSIVATTSSFTTDQNLGSVTYTLEVTDDEGATDIDSAVVTVEEAPAITLDATASKYRGRYNVNLSWTGAGTTNIDVYRDGVEVFTTPNDGSETDNLNQRGGGSYTYQVCEESSATCSPEVLVTF